MKRTYQPSKIKRIGHTDFWQEETPGGRNGLRRRRAKGRKRLTV